MKKLNVLALIGLLATCASSPAQMVSGGAMTDFAKVFGLQSAEKVQGLEVIPLEFDQLTNIVWPGETIKLTLLLRNRQAESRSLAGRVRVIQYRTSVPPEDIWVPKVFKVAEGQSAEIRFNLAGNASTKITIQPKIGDQYGTYGIVLDFGKEGRAWAGTVSRVLRPEPGRVWNPAYAIDMPWPFERSPAVGRTFLKLGVKGCRMEASYSPTTNPNFEESLSEMKTHLKWAHENNVSVMLTLGAGSAPMPLGRGRPWLKDDGTMIEGVKEDLAWLPSYDADFRKYVRLICERYGWPKGPINAVELWNEPWEGVSISGWGADLPRYRELYKQMGLGVMDARKAGAKVMIGGASSSSNTIDKLFPDGSTEFLDMLDFVSIHYQGVGAIPSLVPMWINRKGPYGMVQSWDTESWVANSEDRVPGVVASMLSFGQQRAMGTYAGNTYEATSHDFEGKNYRGVQLWSLSPAVAAVARFIGQRPFRELVFRPGLPWVYHFAAASKPDDGTIVVLGDMGVIYPRGDQWFRTSQAALSNGKGQLSIPASSEFYLFDALGNRLPARNGLLTVPLNSNGYYLRTNGAKGSFARLVRQVRSARIVGYPPVEIVAHDLLAPIGAGNVRITLTNLLNRPIAGVLKSNLSGKGLAATRVQLPPHSSKTVSLATTGVARKESNLYAFSASFEAGSDGAARHKEELRSNVIAHRNIQVDGNLDEWSDVLPQNLSGEGIRASLTEQAWLPFKNLEKIGGDSLSSGKLAYDENGFYFCSQTVDPTPDSGTIRFETRNDDEYYYPEVAKEVGQVNTNFGARWTGTLIAPTSGKYTLFTQSDDGVRLKIGDKLVIDNWSNHGPTWNEGILDLEAGKSVPITLEYFNGSGGGLIRLEWQGPAGQRGLVLSSAFGGGSLRAEYFTSEDLKTSMGVATAKSIDYTVSQNFPDPAAVGVREGRPMPWPEGVRRFSYRKDPDLPSSQNNDGIQIAFNVLPDDRKYLKMAPPGTFPKYMAYVCSDYEYALNAVRTDRGGGTEIWRLLAPGMPRKHFYPRQPKAPVDGGPVKAGKLVTRRAGNLRITECFLPWSEIPDVKKSLDAGKTIKFSFRVNDNNGPSYELAQGRSVSKHNFLAFHNDWNTHWANEVEFAFERKK
ncbi:MAG: PA14 domain-containing protein [Fimbriimonas sp.]